MKEKNNINDIRQILMNELGITRKSVREIMEDIIKDTISKHLKNIENNNIIRDIIRDELDKLANNKDISYNSNSFKNIILTEAKKQIKEFIKTRIHIDSFWKGN